MRWGAWLWRRLSDYGNADLLIGFVGGWRVVASAIGAMFTAGVALGEGLPLWQAILAGLVVLVLLLAAIALLIVIFRALRQLVASRWPLKKVALGGLSTEAGKQPVSPPQMPTLFDVFRAEDGPSVGLRLSAFSDLTLQNEGKTLSVRLFYEVFDDFTSNAKYMSVYVPMIFCPGAGDPPSQTVSVLIYVADAYQKLIDDIQGQRWAEATKPGSTGIISTRSTKFSGKIIAYHGDNLSIENLATLQKHFAEQGLTVEFRGVAFTSSIWASIQLGHSKPLPHYEIKDGVPILAEAGNEPT